MNRFSLIGNITEGFDRPTADSELNAVLRALVSGAQEALGGNFIGAYLQGSFALSGWDADSDVDFIVVTEQELAEDELNALQRLHWKLYDLPSHWAQHLEGSYFPRRLLLRAGAEPSPLWYLDNTHRALEQDSHDDSQVVRWVLRERGLVLSGPAPQTLIDPVPAEALRQEARKTLQSWASQVFAAPQALDNGWYQPYAVLTLCRLLFTLRTGQVASKPVAADWAQAALDPGWGGLIRRALRERANPSLKVRLPAIPADLRLTLDFFHYALNLDAERLPGSLQPQTAPLVRLRAVLPEDLPVFFEQQLDPQANYMAAFSAEDPGDRPAFEAHWAKILADPGICIRTVLYQGQTAGYILSHAWDGMLEVSYWLGKAYWGKGVATCALQQFLEIQPTRPIYGHVVKDHPASLRVLQKCGFVAVSEETWHANARGCDVDELILELR